MISVSCGIACIGQISTSRCRSYGADCAENGKEGADSGMAGLGRRVVESSHCVVNYADGSSGADSGMTAFDEANPSSSHQMVGDNTAEWGPTAASIDLSSDRRKQTLVVVVSHRVINAAWPGPHGRRSAPKEARRSSRHTEQATSYRHANRPKPQSRVRGSREH